MKSIIRLSTRVRDFVGTVTAMLLLNTVAISPADAAPLNLATTPLEVHVGVAPNILLSMDDSGSMTRGYLPDDIDDSDDDERGASSAFNAMYYNPEITYEPAVDKNGNSLGNSDFTDAWDNGFRQGACSDNHDLSKEYEGHWNGGSTCSSGSTMMSNAPSGTGSDDPAYYYEFDASNSGCSNDVSDNDCYDAVILAGSKQNFDTSRSRPTRTDCAGTCTLAQEQQNFANWFSYYRKRHLLAKTAASKAFAGLSTTARVSYQGLNDDYNGDDQSSSGNPNFPLFKAFDGNTRTDFFDWLQETDPDTSAGTPLRLATVRAGKEFSRSGDDSPYAKEPGVTDTPELECRQNFHIAFTDGYWNGDSPGVNNYDDKDNVSLPTNSFGISEYDSQPPYEDSNSNALADVAFKYWVNDLRTDLDDEVSPFVPDRSDYDGDADVDDEDLFWNPANDPANWQHMVNYTVGMGIDGNLAVNQSTYQGLIDGTTNWPATGSTDEAHVDDLWHAAINSRGRYFSARNPSELVNSFADVLQNIEARNTSSAAPAASAPFFGAGTKLYQPAYNTSDWHGNILAYNASEFLNDLNASPSPVWEARDELNGQNYDTQREIITYNPDSKAGVEFRHSALAPTQSAALTPDELDFIRGDRSNEQSNGGSLRNRNYVLGDIVNSGPRFVGPPELLYPDTLESQPYSAFKTTYASRTPMLWFGANDGMLHGLDADTGEELMAFVPNAVFDKLADLTDTGYTHQYYVDGPPVTADAFYDNNWHTVLVGGLNGGGQGIYALDITNPSGFDEAQAADHVLWEFSDADDDDLGYTYSRPSVVRMHNGDWMVIFGNGYNNTESDGNVSSSGDAVLYILDLEKGPKTGGAVHKLSTLVGTAEDPAGLSRPNGLSTAEPVDIDGDFVVDYIYAGDLFGNVWKFDVTDSNPNNWKVAEGSGGSPKPLFVATDKDSSDASAKAQPITSGIKVNLHPFQSGVVLNFGTGQYLQVDDISTTDVQSLYGVWDRMESNISTIHREHTFEQEILFTNTTAFADNNARITSDSQFNFYIKNSPSLPSSPSSDGYLGWHMDLVSVVEDPSDSTKTIEVTEGERIVTTPLRRGDRVLFNTIVPSSSPCSFGGGTSWLMALNATTGARLDDNQFDLNNDRKFGKGDIVTAGTDLNGDNKVDSADRAVAGGFQKKGAGMMYDANVLIGSNGQEMVVRDGDGNDPNINPDFTETHGDRTALGRRSWIQLQIE